MSNVWKTEYGPRRVRREPPTLDEAIFAASGLTDDLEEQTVIAASLMNVSIDVARVAMLKHKQRKDVTRVIVSRRAGPSREVVVERRPARRTASSRPAR